MKFCAGDPDEDHFPKPYFTTPFSIAITSLWRLSHECRKHAIIIPRRPLVHFLEVWPCEAYTWTLVLQPLARHCGVVFDATRFAKKEAFHVRGGRASPCIRARSGTIAAVALQALPVSPASRAWLTTFYRHMETFATEILTTDCRSFVFCTPFCVGRILQERNRGNGYV